MRKKALYTTLTALLLQIILIFVNLIIPRLIILEYGSSVNGLVNSITQFLGYIALLETGIGGVFKSYLYGILSNDKKIGLSEAMNSIRKFFKKICYALIIYVIILCFVFPILSSNSFNAVYTISLLLIISINTFMQYYFGISNQILLQSDQKGYIVNLSKIVTYILSTIIMVILIKVGASIQIVKLIGTIIMIIAPISYYMYVKKNYNINSSKKEDKNILKQRWDGFAHQISFFIHSNADIVLLTLYSTLSEVSVYSVYSLVTSGLKSIVLTFSSSLTSFFGNLFSKKETTKLSYQFHIFDYFNIMFVAFLFTIAGSLITPFVKLYVNGATDANYNRFIFGVLLVLAEAVYCLRCSYSNLISAAGHFKQTKIHGYIESILNVVISILLLKPLGLVGIAIGTLIGMSYRLIASIYYINKSILKLNLLKLIKRYAVNLFVIAIFIFLISYNPYNINTYFIWIITAIIYSIILFILIIAINLLFLKNDLKNVFDEYVTKVVKVFKKGC